MLMTLLHGRMESIQDHVYSRKGYDILKQRCSSHSAFAPVPGVAHVFTDCPVNAGALQNAAAFGQMWEATHHDSNITRSEGEGDVEAIAVPGAAAAHGIPQAQRAQRLQAGTLPCPCPAQQLPNDLRQPAHLIQWLLYC